MMRSKQKVLELERQGWEDSRRKVIKKPQVEIQGMKNAVFELENALDGTSSRSHTLRENRRHHNISKTLQNEESLICCYAHNYHFLNWPSVLPFWFRKVTFRVTNRTFPTCMNAMPNVWIQQSASFWISLPFLDERSRSCIMELCAVMQWNVLTALTAVRLPSRPYISCAEESIDPLGWVAFGYRCTLSSILVSFPKHTLQSFIQ